MKSDFGAWDTEDDSAELLASGASGFDKTVTRVCAVNPKGGWFMGGPGCRDKFLSWLARSPKGAKFYAHNSKYDLGNLFGDNLDELHFSMVGSRLVRAKWRGITFLDSFNIWPMALKKVGQAFGLEKLAMDVHGEKYVRRDVEIVRRAMRFAVKFADERGVPPDEFPATLGGLTVKIWRAMGGENWHCSLGLARAGYYGGRVELFSTGGRGRMLYTDVNSMYPWAMTLPFPVDAQPWAGLPESEARSLKGWGVASVIIDVPKCRLAPLPVRREDGAIWYPYGRLQGVWTLHELRAAIAMGARLVDFVPYLGGVPMVGSQQGYAYYKDYILETYRRRKAVLAVDPQGAEALFLKLLMNNLYGQLAIGGSVSTTIDLETALDEDGEIFRDGIPYGGKFLASVEYPLPPHVNYLHAAYVTAYGRLRLLEFMRQIPADDLIYCDTDAVIFWREGEPPFSIGLELGEMKLEATISRCQTIAPKVYRLTKEKIKDGKKIQVTETKAKGIPNRPSKKHPGQTLPDIFIDKKSVVFELPFGIRESITYYDYYKEHGKTGEQSRKLSVWREVNKRLITTYDKKHLKKGIYYPKRNPKNNSENMLTDSGE